MTNAAAAEPEDEQPEDTGIIPMPAPQLAVSNTWPTDEAAREKMTAKGYAEDIIGDALWLLAHARERGLGSYGELGGIIGYDGTVISRILRGSYAASPQTFVEKVRSFRAIHTQRLSYGEEPFVEALSVVTTLRARCDITRSAQMMSMVWGRNQTGKTSALKHIAASVPDTVYWKIPAGGAVNASIRALARACGISARKSADEAWGRILRRFTPQSLLIVDEFHQALIGRTLKLVLIEKVREIHDDCKCGVLLCGTDVLKDRFEKEDLREFLGQIANRGVVKQFIPVSPTAGDIAKLVHAYGFPPARRGCAGAAKAAEIARAHGIAKLTDYCKMARRLAASAGQPLSWEHFLTAVETLTAWGDETATDLGEDGE